MQYIRKIKWLILIIAAGFYACDDNNFCLSNQHAIQATFYSLSSGSENDTTLTGIYIWGANREDSLIYDSLNISQLFLPTNLNTDSTIFIIKQSVLVNNQVRSDSDFVQFNYSRHLNHVSSECGMTFNLVLDTIIYTNNIIDSVSIGYANINYGEDAENVKIYIEY
ncbi:DUF6452 family protein [Carboxylicivirga caseinilyticus]|uniref:DUF6452 family protein n=1 Tax=Carboxylicivirga caseinilyticus TaxID=3417572 RepID=UPI003D335701|nr:hypothetical protein [Marinilabiliaceae bacterium A049]